MISVKHVDLDALAKKHADIVFKYFEEGSKETVNKNKFSKWLKSYFGSDFNFRNLLLAEPARLDHFAAEFDSRKIKGIKTKCKWLVNLYERFATQSKTPLKCDKKNYSAYGLIDRLGITVCPYCNRNYIYNITEKGLRTSQLDHLYNKDKYPFLAMSFYNLIPSCAICNKLKGDQDNVLSPYDNSYSLQDMHHFEVEAKGPEFIHKINDLTVKLKVDNAAFETNATRFELKNLYEGHADVAQEILKKKFIYTDEYIDQLFTQYEGTLFSTRDELVGLILGNYINDEDLHKRPLAKLTQDIWREVND